MYVRDGLPLLKLSEKEGPVDGYLLQFTDNEAYDNIARFEKGKHYGWGTCAPLDGESPANVLVGQEPATASIHYEWSEWHSDKDPVFTEGMQVVRAMSERYADVPFASAPPDSFDWSRFFQLQMAYLLLWTVLERYSALKYGPQLMPYERRNELSQSGPYQRAFIETSYREHTLFDSRDPAKSWRLDPTDASSSLEYYWAVRCNLSHRGKGAFKDGETVRRSLRELLASTELMLDQTVFRAHDREDAQTA